MKAIRAIATIVTLLILLGSTQAAQAGPIMLFTPDIKITSAYASYDTITFTVKNVGVENAGVFAIHITDDWGAAPAAIYRVSGLLVNESKTFVYHPGQYCFWRTIFADSTDLVFEANEMNNKATVKYNCLDG
jgi:hypothetical protein